MAQISFKGYVEDWTKNTSQHPNWAMKVSEPHRKQENGEWVTTGRTYRTVKAGWEVELDFTLFKKGDFVEIVGKELTESSEKDGKRYDNLVVKAETIQVVPKSDFRGATASVTTLSQIADIADAPF